MTTQPKHTQGPWLVDEVDCMVYGANNLRVADCSCDEQEDMTDDAMEANARLTAAAPELLEALNKLCDLPADDYGERIIPAGFLDTARAAIAKATGGAAQELLEVNQYTLSAIENLLYELEGISGNGTDADRKVIAKAIMFLRATKAKAMGGI